MLLVTALSAFLFTRGVNAHVGAWTKGMYCEYGSGVERRSNSGDPANPLYNLKFKEWWMHHNNKCDEFPPPDGDFLELPAGNSFTAELVSNHAFSTLSYEDYKNARVTDWADGENHSYTDDYYIETCIKAPNLHTQSKSMAAGTAFAISYNSDIAAVTPDNLVVFTVAYNTPWKRVATYHVPAAMPECPPGGCICAWGWVPNGCGEPNMFMQPYKCKVTGAKSTTPLATPKPPVWCEDNPGECVKGAKQMIYWHQAEGDNVKVEGLDKSGRHKSPAYNAKMGFGDGAQNDIFQGTPETSPSPTPTTSDSDPTITKPPALVANPAKSDPAKSDRNSDEGKPATSPSTTSDSDPTITKPPALVANPAKSDPAKSDSTDKEIPPCLKNSKKPRDAGDVENVIRGLSAHRRHGRQMF